MPAPFLFAPFFFAAAAKKNVCTGVSEMSSEIAKLLKDFKQEMREMRTALEKEFRKEYKELKSSIDFFSTQFDTMATRCAKIEKENATLKKDNAALLAECQSFKKLATTSEQRLTDVEQYSRNKNLEIKGIPCCCRRKPPSNLAAAW